jgi:hypothetical protein
MPTFCSVPPESLLTFRLRYSVMPSISVTSFILLSTSAGWRPERRPKVLRDWSTVLHSCREVCWGRYPMVELSSAFQLRIDLPSMVTSPWKSRMRPVMILMVVVFPEPFGPM